MLLLFLRASTSRGIGWNWCIGARDFWLVAAWSAGSSESEQNLTIQRHWKPHVLSHPIKNVSCSPSIRKNESGRSVGQVSMYCVRTASSKDCHWRASLGERQGESDEDRLFAMMSLQEPRWPVNCGTKTQKIANRRGVLIPAGSMPLRTSTFYSPQRNTRHGPGLTSHEGWERKVDTLLFRKLRRLESKAADELTSQNLKLCTEAAFVSFVLGSSCSARQCNYANLVVDSALWWNGTSWRERERERQQAGLPWRHPFESDISKYPNRIYTNRYIYR